MLIIYGKCNWNGDYLYRNIQRVQRDSQQAVIVATDNRTHPVIVKLMERLGTRGTFMSVGPECASAIAVGHSLEDTAHLKSLYDAVTEWQGLFGVERFLGSFSRHSAKSLLFRGECAMLILYKMTTRLGWSSVG